MEKKFLIAVDGSVCSVQAVEYASGLLHQIKDSTCTLFHVQPMISDYLREDAKTDMKINEKLKRLIGQNASAADRLLSSLKTRMTRTGIPASRIEVRSQQRIIGLARDIIDYGCNGLFDAVVVGRRGLSKVQKAFLGSTSTKLLEHATELPVWLVDQTPPTGDILVAVDGSKTSYKLIDYLSYIYSQVPDISITCLHVPQQVMLDIGEPDILSDLTELATIVERKDTQRMDEFYQYALRKFAVAGLCTDTVKFVMSSRKGKVGKIIMDEAVHGNYGTVVIGRRGISNAFYFGSTSMYVTQRITDRVLWLIG